MKKILLLLFIGVSILCQAIETNLVDSDSDFFPYELQNVTGTVNDYSAKLLDKRINKVFTIKKGDRLKSLDSSKSELIEARDFIAGTLIDKKKQEIIKDMKDDFSALSLPVPDFSLLHLDPLQDYINLSDKELETKLAYLTVADIQEDFILINDPFRHINYKLYKRFENKQTFAEKVDYTDVKMNKISGDIIIDSVKDNYYGTPVKSSDYSISGAYDDDYLYLYIEYNLKEPVAKHSDIYFLSFNEQTLDVFYEGMKFEDYLELEMILAHEKDYKDFIEGRRSSLDIDLWNWEYANSTNKYIPDFTVEFSKNNRNISDDSDIEKVNIKDKQGRDNYLYIKPDSGNPASAFTFEPDFSQFKPTSEIFIPVRLSFNPSGSQKDVIISTGMKDDDRRSPFYKGKIIFEIKRKLNTGHRDDVKINEGDSLLFRLFKSQTKYIGFTDSFRLIF